MVTVDVGCDPGPGAWAAVERVDMLFSESGLVLYLDPGCVSILPPVNREEWPQFVRFLRQLAKNARELADQYARASGEEIRDHG